jgi:hypothetical protein
LIDINGGSLQSGDPVNIWVGGYYFRAYNGGGSGLDASHSFIPNQYETFIIYRLAGNGAISSGDQVALRALHGYWVVAEGGGGGVVNANRTAVGPWETFRIWW